MALPSGIPELGALDLLLSVADLGSLGLAAKAHGISQPAASARVQHMEDRLGLQLLDRSPRGSRLSPAGSALVEHARRVIAAATDLAEVAESLRNQRETRVRIVASRTISRYLIPSWLVTLRARVPGVVLQLHAPTNSADAARMVVEGEADVAFLEGPEVPASLQSRLVGTDRLVVVVAPHHPWARRPQPVTAAELAAARLITREPGSGTRETVDRLLADCGRPGVPVLELASTSAIKAVVTSGEGAAVLSELALEHDVEEGRLVIVAIQGLDLTRSLRIVWPSGRRLEGPSRELFLIARQHGEMLAQQPHKRPEEPNGRIRPSAVVVPPGPRPPTSPRRPLPRRPA